MLSCIFFMIEIMNKYLLLLLLTLVSSSFSIKAQERIIIYSESIDSLFNWFNNGFMEDEIAHLLTIPANQIMEQLLLENEKDASTFTDVLLRFKVEHSLPNNDYLLNDAYEKQEQILKLRKSLLDFILDHDPIGYVKGYLPASFIPSSQYQIFFTATGWQWGDAMAFNYIKDNNNYVLSQEGISAMIFNLTIINATYGETIEKQISSFQRVLAHELFHTFLEEYVSEKNYYNPDQIESKARFMLMNEGIAHFIADGEYIKANYNKLKEKEESSFSLFSEKAKIIFNGMEEINFRNGALEEGLYGSYWGKYVCITGLFMAYHISEQGGQELLRECVEKGYDFFIEEYKKISMANDDRPSLPEIFYQ